MSFWSRLGNVAKASFQTISPIGQAWALAEDYGNQEDGSFLSKFYAAERQFSQQSLGNIATGLTTPYKYAVSRPLSTALIATDKPIDDPTMYQADTWTRAWEQAEEVSPGQAVVVNAVNWWNDEDRYSFDGAGAADREELFHHTWRGRLASGAIDLSLNLFVDPLVIGGKAAKGLEEGISTVGRADVPQALDASTGAARGADVSRQAAVAGGRLSRLYARTDDLTFEEMINLPEFRDTPDASVLAAMFSDANLIDDRAARWAAKRDIYGVALGNPESVARLRIEQSAMAQRMKRFVTPVENSNGLAAFSFNDLGIRQVEYFNSPDRLSEVIARQREIEAEIGRLDRLTSIQGTTARVGRTLGDKFGHGVRTARMQESLAYSTPGGRPVRVVTGALGAHVPGHVNTVDVDQGVDQLGHILGRSAYLSRESKTKYIREFAAAPDRTGRNQVVHRVENALYSAIGEAEGYTPEEIHALYQSTTGVRKTWSNALRSRLYTAASNNESSVSIIDDDGVVNAFGVPFLRSHFASNLPLTDPKALEALVKADKNTRWLERFARRWHFSGDAATRITDTSVKAADIFDDMASAAMRAWKFSALFRLAYPMRIQVDTQLRLVASLGAMQYMLTARAGAVNSLENRAGILRAIPGGRVMNPEQPAERRRYIQDIGRLDDEIVRASSPARRARLTAEREKLARKRDAVPGRVRRGQTEAKATIFRQDTETYQGIPIRPAINPNDTAVLSRVLGQDGTTAQLMSDMTAVDTASLRASGGFEVVTGGQKNWDASYLRAVNQQFRNSPTAMRIINTPDDDAVAAFVRENPDALDEWNYVRESFDSIEDWVAYTRHQVDHLMTDNIAQILRERPVRPSDVKAEFSDVASRPPVHGEAYSFSRNSPVAEFMKKWAERWYKFASDGPEAVMGRHPLYNARFREHMRNQIDRTDSEFVDERAIAAMRKNADRMARRDVADTLYDLTKRSNASYAFRHFSPFFAAWEDTMLKWGRLFYENPATGVRFAQGWQAPNAAGLVVDDEGNVIKGGKHYDSVTGEEIKDEALTGEGEYVVLPKWASPGTSGGTLRLSKGSFNIVFQGEPWWLPGAGPLAQIPANQIVKSAFPEHADSPIAQAILPFGVTNKSIVDQALPSWITKAREAFNASTARGAGSEQYASVYSMFTAQAWAEYNLDPSKGKPNAKKIANQTRNWFILRAVTAQASPVSVQPQPKLQLYIDKAHQYRNKYGLGKRDAEGNVIEPSWEDKFFEDFPEYFELSMSLSVNNTGITASVKAHDATKKYRRFIAKDPELGWMFVGADNVGDFHQGVYTWQRGTAIGYGQQETFRGKASPAESIAGIRAEKGWIQYNQAMTWVNLQLEQRGLHSLQQKGAEDLSAAKKQYVEQLSLRNSDWADAYNRSDDGKVQRMARVALDAMREDRGLASRPDMQAFLRYLQAREWVRGELASRGAAGESSSLSNPANGDLDSAWRIYTQNLVKSNIGFEQMWNRVLNHDDLSRDLFVVGAEGG